MRRTWGAALAVAGGLVSLGGSAHAAVLSDCLTGCLIPDGDIFTDYTVPDDGRLYRWDLYTSDPGIVIHLNSPNQTFDEERVSNGDGTTHGDAFLLGGAGFTWNVTETVGHTEIYTQVLQTRFNNCNPASPAGEICAARFNVWGNGTALSVTRNGVLVRAPESPTVFLTITAIPEPATWAMMLVGFFGLGAALRRKRAAPLTT